MKIQRIYIDTSAMGGCFDPEFAEWSNGLLQDFRNGTFQPLHSEVIGAEIEDTPEEVQVAYAELIALNAEILTVEESALERRLSRLPKNYSLRKSRFSKTAFALTCKHPRPA